jgi:hypothetical protein
MYQQKFLINQHPSSDIARIGLGEFPVTSLSETELFEKFAVPQAEILDQGQYLYLRDIQTFSGVNLDLSGTEPAGRAQCGIFNQIMTTLIIRSLDFLLLFDQAKRRRNKRISSIFGFSLQWVHQNCLSYLSVLWLYLKSVLDSIYPVFLIYISKSQ